MTERRINNTNIYYAQHVVNKDSYILNIDSEQFHNLVKNKNIQSLSQFICENLKEQQISIDDTQQDVIRHSIAMLPPDEYERLKKMEKIVNRLIEYNYINEEDLNV